MKIKICGVTNTDDALWAANLGADFIGLNFYPPSPRKVTVANGKKIAAELPPFVQTVGVFVDEAPAAIAKAIKSVPLKVVQLHGNETPEVCAEIKQLGVAVWKVIRLTGPLDPDAWTAYRDHVDAFLFDKHSDEAMGGTGQVFDWTWLARAPELGKPWYLSGGLNTDNVVDAIKQSHPNGVDVCSGVERLPTRKDYDKLKGFIQKVRMGK